MKKSTKFFILTTVINVVLSVITIFSTLIKEIRLVDIATFYATAFGAGASVAALVFSFLKPRQAMTDK